MPLASCLTIRKRLLPAAAGIAVMASALAPAAHAGGFIERYWERHIDAQSRAWCAYYSGTSSSVECSFDTFAQCRAAVSGVGGYCGANPRYLAATEEGAPRRHSRHERRWRP